jgi:acyl carrier protein
MAVAHSAHRADPGVTASPGSDPLRDTIAAVFGVDPTTLTDASSPDSVPGWDSLNHLTMAMAVEGEFGIAFEADEVMAMRDIGCVRAAVRAHGGTV